MKTINQLVINKFQATDFDLYYLLVGNDKVMEMITEWALLRTEALERYEKIILNNQIHPAFGYYKIIDSDSGNFMGFAKMQVTDPNPEEAELGYVLLPD